MISLSVLSPPQGLWHHSLSYNVLHRSELQHPVHNDNHVLRITDIRNSLEDVEQNLNNVRQLVRERKRSPINEFTSNINIVGCVPIFTFHGKIYWLVPNVELISTRTITTRPSEYRTSQALPLWVLRFKRLSLTTTTLLCKLGIGTSLSSFLELSCYQMDQQTLT